MNIKDIEKEIKKWGFKILYRNGEDGEEFGVDIYSGNPKLVNDSLSFDCSKDKYDDTWNCYVRVPWDEVSHKMIHPEEVPYNLKEAQEACIIWFYNKY